MAPKSKRAHSAATLYRGQSYVDASMVKEEPANLEEALEAPRDSSTSASYNPITYSI